MAAGKLPDLDALALERVQLQRKLRDLQVLHERLQDRQAAFPNEVTAKKEQQVAAELEVAINRIDQIDATLLPFRMHP